jgi:hypothetical protein
MLASFFYLGRKVYEPPTSSPSWFFDVSRLPFASPYSFEHLDSGMVYDDAEVLYGEVKSDGEALLEEAFSILFPNSVPLTSSTRSKSLAGSSKIIAYNTTFFPRWDIVKIPLAKAGNSLKSMVLQASDDGREGYAIMHCPNGGGPGELKHPSNALHAHLKPVSGANSPLFYTFR